MDGSGMGEESSSNIRGPLTPEDGTIDQDEPPSALNALIATIFPEPSLGSLSEVAAHRAEFSLSGAKTIQYFVSAFSSPLPELMLKDCRSMESVMELASKV